MITRRRFFTLSGAALAPLPVKAEPAEADAWFAEMHGGST
jgi:hypothetical protein